MYQVFLGVMPLPMAPSKITTHVGNRSQTIELIDGNEATIIKGSRLQEISFEAMIPAQQYPFMTVMGSLAGSVLGSALGAVTSTAIFEYLEKLKNDRETFDFLCVRLTDGKLPIGSLYNTSIKVTLEDYTITEDANNGLDYMVAIRLKEYRPYGTKTYNRDGTVSKERP